MVRRTHDTLRHRQTRFTYYCCLSVLGPWLFNLDPILRPHAYTTFNTLYTYRCRYVQIQLMPM